MERRGRTVAWHVRAGYVDEWRIEAILVIASTMRHKVDIVEVVDVKYLWCVGMVRGFETSDVHVEDFIVLEVTGGFAGEDAEEREGEDGDRH